MQVWRAAPLAWSSRSWVTARRARGSAWRPPGSRPTDHASIGAGGRETMQMMNAPGSRPGLFGRVGTSLRPGSPPYCGASRQSSWPWRSQQVRARRLALDGAGRRLLVARRGADLIRNRRRRANGTVRRIAIELAGRSRWNDRSVDTCALPKVTLAPSMSPMCLERAQRTPSRPAGLSRANAPDI